MLVMHISGVFAPAILDPSSVKNTDYVIPALVTKYMDPAVAGLFIAAPLAAVMSTVSSLLILASATIVKDLYLNYIVKSQDKRKELLKSRKIAIVSWVTTLVIGSIVFVLTIYPPDIIVWINLFAMGGLECAFFCPIVFGLFWKKANKNGCILSSLCGVISFLVISNTGFSLFGTMAIVPSMIISVITFVIGSFLGGKNETLCRDAVTANR